MNRLLVVTLLLNLAIANARQPAVPDFLRARDEAVRVLQDLIRLDTSNPPGNETKAATYLKQALEREGIAAQIFERAPGRGNLVARLEGSGRKRPVLVMGHTDVVGVERDKWTVDPFGGVIKEGYVYGRGASDDKDSVTAGLVTLLLLHRQKVPLDRDVIFLAEAGEEGTSEFGIDFMIEKHWDRIAAEYAIAEGGFAELVNGQVRFVGVATTEKVPRGLRLVARGVSGHGSVPREDNPIQHLAAAVAKLRDYQTPMRLNDTTRAFFTRMADLSSPEDAALYRQLLDPAQARSAETRIRAKSPRFNSMLRTSITPTILKGGFRSNVIPAQAEAVLDVRALPDEDMDRLIADLRRVIADPAVEIVKGTWRRPASTPSSLDSEMFRAIERTQAVMYPKAATVPTMLTGATDNAQLRAKGVQAYGIGPAGTEASRAAHGNDEKIAVDALGRYVEFIYRAVVEIAAVR
jgi:acetylornithine deacetylase/succinyl-diaminopimelate desuccinylase-like protein